MDTKAWAELLQLDTCDLEHLLVVLGEVRDTWDLEPLRDLIEHGHATSLRTVVEVLEACVPAGAELDPRLLDLIWLVAWLEEPGEREPTLTRLENLTAAHGAVPAVARIEAAIRFDAGELEKGRSAFQRVHRPAGGDAVFATHARFWIEPVASLHVEALSRLFVRVHVATVEEDGAPDWLDDVPAPACLGLADALMDEGRFAAAIEVFKAADRTVVRRPPRVWAQIIAAYWAQGADVDALEVVAAALSEGDVVLPLLNRDPRLEGLREDSRFLELVRPDEGPSAYLVELDGLCGTYTDVDAVLTLLDLLVASDAGALTTFFFEEARPLRLRTVQRGKVVDDINLLPYVYLRQGDRRVPIGAADLEAFQGDFAFELDRATVTTRLPPLAPPLLEKDQRWERQRPQSLPWINFLTHGCVDAEGEVVEVEDILPLRDGPGHVPVRRP